MTRGGRIAYLSCRETLSTASTRRSDAFEHDHMLACLGPALGAHGFSLDEVLWDDNRIDWGGYAAALVGTTWDYQDRLPDFLAAMRALDARLPVFNPADMLVWNSTKTYLRDLSARGIAVVPTQWIDTPDAGQIAACFAHFGTDTLVVKRQTGASAVGQARVTAGGPLPMFSVPVMVQPYLASVEAQGETSVVVIDGQISHAIRKCPARGDYRTQSLYGAIEEPADLSVRDRDFVAHVLSSLTTVPLYARVDFLRGADDAPQLMELELIEPYLYPEQGPDLGTLVAAALAKRLA